MTDAQATAVIDLDGVVWLAGEPLPKVGEAISLLRDAHFDVIFATNNSSPTTEQFVERLARAGIEAHATEIVTAAHAAAAAVAVGSSVIVIGDEGLQQAAKERNLIAADAPEAVLVGWHRAFTFDLIATAATAIRKGASFIATNDDPTHPTPNGLLPGTGSLVAAIATAAEQPALIAGKPGASMTHLVRSRLETVAIVIGDRPSTDGEFAKRLEAPFGLVASAATPATGTQSAFQGNSLYEVVTSFLDSLD